MTKVDLVRAAGMGSESIDYALPQAWVDKCRELGIRNPEINYVWHYPHGGVHGEPVSLGELFAKALERGAIIPQEIAYDAIDMGLNGWKKADIFEAIKQACKHY